MTGEIAPKMDIKRLLACLTITENKELKYVAKAIPAVQTVVDSRDILYLWVYHHHISIYTDYIIGRILKSVDSERLMRQFAYNGFLTRHEPRSVGGEIVVVNTCGFIGSAKEESINTILSLIEIGRAHV